MLGYALALAGSGLTHRAVEHAMRRVELPGYAAFTRRTRSRLIPAIW